MRLIRVHAQSQIPVLFVLGIIDDSRNNRPFSPNRLRIVTRHTPARQSPSIRADFAPIRPDAPPFPLTADTAPDAAALLLARHNWRSSGSRDYSKPSPDRAARDLSGQLVVAIAWSIPSSAGGAEHDIDHQDGKMHVVIKLPNRCTDATGQTSLVERRVTPERHAHA